MLHDESATQDDHEDIGKAFVAPVSEVLCEEMDRVDSVVCGGNTSSDGANDTPVNLDSSSTEKEEFLENLVDDTMKNVFQNKSMLSSLVLVMWFMIFRIYFEGTLSSQFGKGFMLKIVMQLVKRLTQNIWKMLGIQTCLQRK